MLALLIIGYECIPHTHSLWVVPKKRGKSRLINDLQVNKSVKLIKIQSERMENLLSRINGTKWLSLLHLCCSYSQFRISKSSQPCVAFSFEGQQFSSRRSSFGFRNSSSILNAGLQQVLGANLHANILRYVDDFPIFNNTFEEHMATLQEIFYKLMAADVTLNLEKCCLFSRRMNILGINITPQGIIED